MTDEPKPDATEGTPDATPQRGKLTERVPCHHCGKPMRASADECPHCKKPRHAAKTSGTGTSLLIPLAGVLAIVGLPALDGPFFLALAASVGWVPPHGVRGIVFGILAAIAANRGSAAIGGDPKRGKHF